LRQPSYNGDFELIDTAVDVLNRIRGPGQRAAASAGLDGSCAILPFKLSEPDFLLEFLIVTFRLASSSSIAATILQ
jgi:hypothetical protein